MLNTKADMFISGVLLALGFALWFDGNAKPWLTGACVLVGALHMAFGIFGKE